MTLPFQPIEQHLQLGEAVYKAIEEAIVKGDLKPGDRLMLHELAEYFNTSITPVREACARLEKAGLLTKEPRKGWSVRTLTSKEIVELYETRAALESFAARLCSERITEAGIKELEALQARGRELLKTADLDGYSRYNEAFHNLIMDFADNETLKDLSASLHHRVRLCMTRTIAMQGRPEKAIGEHEQLVKAIAQRKATDAAQIMEEHILDAMTDVVAMLENQTTDDSVG